MKETTGRKKERENSPLEMVAGHPVYTKDADRKRKELRGKKIIRRRSVRGQDGNKERQRVCHWRGQVGGLVVCLETVAQKEIRDQLLVHSAPTLRGELQLRENVRIKVSPNPFTFHSVSVKH